MGRQRATATARKYQQTHTAGDALCCERIWKQLDVPRYTWVFVFQVLATPFRFSSLSRSIVQFLAPKHSLYRIARDAVCKQSLGRSGLCIGRYGMWIFKFIYWDTGPRLLFCTYLLYCESARRSKVGLQMWTRKNEHFFSSIVVQPVVKMNDRTEIMCAQTLQNTRSHTRPQMHFK